MKTRSYSKLIHTKQKQKILDDAQIQADKVKAEAKKAAEEAKKQAARDAIAEI